MAFLNFVPTSCHLRVEIKPEQPNRGAFALTGGLEREADGDHVELSNGQYLEKLEGTFVLVDGGLDSVKDDKCIGHLGYTEEPERTFYSVEVNIPTREFAAVHDAVKEGRLPRGISVSVDDLSFDFPSHSTWDTRKSDKLPINYVSLSIPIVGDKGHGFFANSNTKKRRTKAR